MSSSQHQQPASKANWKQPYSYPRLDHVCIPTPHVDTIAPFVYNTLLGVNAEGGENPLFSGVSWYIGSRQSKLETIIPTAGADVKTNFLQRFLSQHGTTVHHVTFLVDSIYEARRNAASLGYTVVGFDDKSDPDWLEMFLVPKQSGGIVVQCAQQGDINDYSEEKQRALAWGPKYGGFPNHLSKQQQSSNNNTRSNIHMLGVRLRWSNKQQSIKLWQHLLNGKLQRTVREQTDDGNDVEVLYFNWVHSPMYIAVQIEEASTNAKDGFICIELATSDNSPLDLIEKNTGVKARFRQIPMPQQQLSNL